MMGTPKADISHEICFQDTERTPWTGWGCPRWPWWGCTSSIRGWRRRSRHGRTRWQVRLVWDTRDANANAKGRLRIWVCSDKWWFLHWWFRSNLEWLLWHSGVGLSENWQNDCGLMAHGNVKSYCWSKKNTSKRTIRKLGSFWYILSKRETWDSEMLSWWALWSKEQIVGTADSTQ